MDSTLKPGVYRSPSGHTIVVNKFHPEDTGVPEGYEWIATEAEFAKGEFHPYAMPGSEPEGWTPETAEHGGGPVGAAPAPAAGVSQEEVAEIVAAAVAKAQAESDKKLAAAVAKAVEAATK